MKSRNNKYQKSDISQHSFSFTSKLTYWINQMLSIAYQVELFVDLLPLLQVGERKIIETI